MSLTIGENIIKFSGEASGDQISYLSVIDDVTERTVRIDGCDLENIFGNRFRIPDYQRGYQWHKEEWDDLLEELNELFEIDSDSAGRDVSDVFFGSMFLSRQSGGEESSDEVFEVIDGQQRITSLMILFYIIREKLNYRIRNDETGDLFELVGDEPGSIGSMIYRSTGAGAANEPAIELDSRNDEFFKAILGDDDDRLEYILSEKTRHPNTKNNVIQVSRYLRKSDIDTRKYFEALNNEESYTSLDDPSKRPNLYNRQLRELDDDDDATDLEEPTKQDILDNKIYMQETNLKLLNAYDTFGTWIEDHLADLDTPKQESYALTNLKNYLLKSFHIGYFRVEEENPQLLMKIFEILNDRGVELKITDIIRTRVVGLFRGEADGDDFIDK